MPHEQVRADQSRPVLVGHLLETLAVVGDAVPSQLHLEDLSRRVDLDLDPLTVTLGVLAGVTNTVLCCSTRRARPVIRVNIRIAGKERGYVRCRDATN